MKAALALVFLACFAGAMASDARGPMIDQIIAQGQGLATVILGQLHQTIVATLQTAVGQISSLVGAIGGRLDILDSLVAQVLPTLQALANNALSSILVSISGLIGGARIEIGSIFAEFFGGVQTQIMELGQHFLNQGLAAVLGGLGSLGSRALGDIFAGLSAQIGAAVNAAQGALTGALGGLQTLGSQILDASKPHWEQLQEQLVGHGLNVLGSLSETINNVHGSIVGGR